MIVTDHFVFIHVSRTGGTFLNNLILGEFPGARMVQYRGRFEDLPPARSRLPVIGFVRNPWDRYVSMHQDYRRKRQYVFQVLSEQGALDFERTVARFLNLGDGSGESRALLRPVPGRAGEVEAPHPPSGADAVAVHGLPDQAQSASIGSAWMISING